MGSKKGRKIMKLGQIFLILNLQLLSLMLPYILHEESSPNEGNSSKLSFQEDFFFTKKKRMELLFVGVTVECRIVLTNVKKIVTQD